jgi:hypothetical protein
MEAVFGISVLCLTFGFAVYQILVHRQRVKMIEKGITRLEISQPRSQADTSLKYGLILIALGLAVYVAQVFERFDILIGGEIALAFIPIFVGVALLISARFEKRRETSAPQQANQMKNEGGS